MSEHVDQLPTFGARLSAIARDFPDEPALHFAPINRNEYSISWSELEAWTNRMAHLLVERGVTPGSMVVTGVWNTPELVAFVIAAWKAGARALPLRAVLPPRERDQILELAQPPLVLAEWEDLSWSSITPAELHDLDKYSPERLPFDPEHLGKAIASGGSTGRSKIVIDKGWHPCRPLVPGRGTGSREGQVQLLATPLYHNSPYLATFHGLGNRNTVVVMEKFDAEYALDLIERYQVNYAYLPPVVMLRLSRVENIHERDFSSLESIQSSAAPCPPWLKRFWIDLIGPEKVIEVYGSSEGIGATLINGVDWLEHPGSVGRPIRCEMKILDPDGNELPPGEVGEIFMRPLDGGTSTFEYIGAPPIRSYGDRFKSVGDLGWVDEDGFLYISDRRVDLIVSGGANVYPAEVEAALSEHLDVADVAVIGVPDTEWGKRVHAVVEVYPDRPKPTAAELDAFCRERLTSYKAPKTYEFIDQLPRNEAGKIRRSALADERSSGWIEGMVLAKGPAQSPVTGSS